METRLRVRVNQKTRGCRGYRGFTHKCNHGRPHQPQQRGLINYSNHTLHLASPRLNKGNNYTNHGNHAFFNLRAGAGDEQMEVRR